MTVVIGDKPTGLYLAYNYRFDVCSWDLRLSEGRELLLCLVDVSGIFECWCNSNVWTSTMSGSAWQHDGDASMVSASMDGLFDWALLRGATYWSFSYYFLHGSL